VRWYHWLLMSVELQFWPLLLGWTVVVLLVLNGWRRSGAVTAAGMLMVTWAVLAAATGRA
jgi:hypothetical protein